jgi:hypothetical protein
MGFTRQRSNRPDPARRTQSRTPEQLESRLALATVSPSFLSLYTPSDLYVTNPITHQRIPTSIRSLMQHNNPNSDLLSNQGKIVSGVDRAGDQWTITVHGPGQVIVTDTTPNDGALDDDIATIQVINSNPQTTYVTGTVIASNRELTSGQVLFDRLIAADGVRSIVLNGFDLSADVTPTVNQTPGIFLYGGVQTLKFNDIDAIIDTAVSTNPTEYQIVIGDPSTPLRVKPSIYLDSINNSVFDSSSTTIPSTPITTPSVLLSVNGVVQNFSVVSMTQSPIPPNYIEQSKGGTIDEWTGVPQSGPIPAGYQFLFNVVGTTGRTSLQALAINNLNVRGKATNFTAQRDTTPFGSSLSGLEYLRKATFGANADAVALDVKGAVGRLTFKRGLGDPTAVFNAKKTVANTNPNLTPNTVYLPATNYGVPLGSEGYPAHGLLGGVVTAKSIRSLRVGPANYAVLTAQNPKFIITGSTRTAQPYLVNPGTALTNAAITTQGSIGKVKVTGNQLNTEIKTGFDYQSYLAGLQGTREASRIARITQRGDLVNSVDSATFRPAKNTTTGQYVYSTTTGTAGNGSITGTSTLAVGHGIDAASYSKLRIPGSAYNTGGRTALGNYGAGFFARRIRGNLPRANG